MEAAQITRTIAKVLRLNEDLAEAVALAHDLGHTPFGHAGEHTLNELMAEHGGFEHNAQSLRIVDVLEERYPSFPGLNLSWEVREGIVKHSTPYNRPAAATFQPDEAPSLEAQIVDYADEIAYNAHDIDDGLKSGFLSLEQLDSVPVWRKIFAEVRDSCPASGLRIWRYQAIRRLIDLWVTDFITTLRRRIAENAIATLADVRSFGKPLVGFSSEVDNQRRELKAFLMQNLYRHYRVVRMTVKVQRVMADLFRAYTGEPSQLPPHILSRQSLGESLPRIIADYIAGMTDRFAIEEHRKLFEPEERV
jgi:dGTPase